MPYPYIDTPLTGVGGNATYLGHRSAGRTHLSALDSVENSFQTPSKEGDVIKSIEDDRKRRASPRGAWPVRTKSGGKSGRQLPTAGPATKGEFTPLMQSATRNNMLKINRGSSGVGGGPKTPAFLKENYRSNANTPGLPEVTGIDDEDQTYDDEITPVPQAASSSVQGTPLPMLPGRDGGGILNDGQNMMTLKEQEKVASS